MAVIGRMVVEWTGGSGLPGYNVIYNDGTSVDAVADLVTFFTAIEDLIPRGISVAVPSSGDSFDDGSGAISGFWSGGAGATIAGNGSTDHAAGVGVAVQWNTAGIVNRRRVRGRSFLCPLSLAIFDSDGTLFADSRATLQSAADALAAAGNLVVWSRPTSTTSLDGSSNAVVGATVPDRGTALRSRRY